MLVEFGLETLEQGKGVGSTAREPRQNAPVVDAPNRSAVAPTTEGVGGLANVAAALRDTGVEVEDLSLRQPTLDEVFLTLTGHDTHSADPSTGASDSADPTESPRTESPRTDASATSTNSSAREANAA